MLRTASLNSEFTGSYKKKNVSQFGSFEQAYQIHWEERKFVNQ